MTDTHDLERKFSKAIDHDRTVMLGITGVAPRPMTALAEDDKAPLWFFTASGTDLAESLRGSMEARNIRAPLRFAAALSDGQTVFAFRYASDDKPPSLYVNRCDHGTVLASEPLQDRANDCCPEWSLVPPNTAVTVSCGQIEMEAFALQHANV